MRKAVFEKATGIVVNMILLDDGANWQPPDGCDVVDAGGGNIGDIWDGTQFLAQEIVAPVLDATLWAIQSGLAQWDSLAVAPKLEVVKIALGILVKDKGG